MNQNLIEKLFQQARGESADVGATCLPDAVRDKFAELILRHCVKLAEKMMPGDIEIRENSEDYITGSEVSIECVIEEIMLEFEFS